ncbi:MAG TPA: hypothetical protein VM243_17305 [Phycisphaerae bacterium]|nr:hypothetical protein [Phycisphaerae bacterium]
MQDIETTLRDAARQSGLSIAELGRRAELPYAVVHGFVTSGRLITLRSAAGIARALGLELRTVKPRRKAR